jgi:hypothetical protein
MPLIGRVSATSSGRADRDGAGCNLGRFQRWQLPLTEPSRLWFTAKTTIGPTAVVTGGAGFLGSHLCDYRPGVAAVYRM